MKHTLNLRVNVCIMFTQYSYNNIITQQYYYPKTSDYITCKLKYIHRNFLLIEMGGLHTAVSFSSSCHRQILLHGAYFWKWDLHSL